MKSVMAIIAILLASGASALTTTRSCNYSIQATASSPDIGYFEIGTLKSTTAFSHTTIQSNPKRAAREAAASGAFECLSDARTSATKPTSCTNPRWIIGETKIDYNIDNLEETAKNALCRKILDNNLGNGARTYRVLVRTRGGTDVRRECNVENRLEPIISGTNLNCSVATGKSASRPEQRWSKWYSDKSPKQMHAWIAGYCQNDRNSKNSEILRWEMDTKTGAYRVLFFCK